MPDGGPSRRQLLAHVIAWGSPWGIRRLVRLAVEGPVRLLLASVTKGEVMDDLEDMAREGMAKLKEVRREWRVIERGHCVTG